MYVCLCNAVSDQQIKEAVDAGAEDLESIQSLLGAGLGCGTCAEFTEHLINESLAAKLGYAA